MTATATTPAEVTRYLEQVRATLADLPASQREELLVDVEAPLCEAASEAGGSLTLKLGPPQAFAAELRASAGLEPGPPPPSRAIPWRQLGFRLRPFLHELAPLWWLLRAYVAIAVAGALTAATWPDRFKFLPMLHSGTVTLALLATAVVVSVGLGLYGRARGERALDVVLALALIPLTIHLIDVNAWETGAAATPGPYVAPAAQPATAPAAQPAVLAYHGRPVLNVYPYDRSGRLLHDVRLYTETGEPLALGSKGGAGDPLRRVPRDARGRPALNAVPLRYFDPGSRTVRHPNAAPRRRVVPMQSARR